MATLLTARVCIQAAIAYDPGQCHPDLAQGLNEISFFSLTVLCQSVAHSYLNAEERDAEQVSGGELISNYQPSVCINAGIIGKTRIHR